MTTSLTRSLLVLVLLGGALVTSASSAPSKSARSVKGLPQKLQQTLATIIEAAQAGDSKTVWDQLHAAATKMKKEVRVPFEKGLADEGLPNMASLLLRARLAAQSRGVKIPEPDLKERVLLIGAAREEIEASLKFVAQHPAVQGTRPAPRTMEAYESLFRDLGTMANRLSAAELLASNGIAVRKKIEPSALARLTDDEKDIVAGIDDVTLSAVHVAAQGVSEIALELRLRRFEYGLEILQKPDLTEDRFKAAYSTQVDGKVLLDEVASRTPGVKNPAPPFLREPLRKLQIADLTARLKQATHLAGPLVEKTRNLFLGLQWWLRGRYGSGPDVGGLAKSAQALSDPQLLLSVRMPETLPDGEVASPQRRGAAPCFDRRHHYTWAWEDRKLARWFGGMVTKSGEIDMGAYVGSWVSMDGKGPSKDAHGLHNVVKDVYEYDITTTTRITERIAVLPAQDPRLVYRIVGFLEYGIALQLLNAFIEQASIAELEIADKIVRDQEPFALETNLSRKIEQPGPLSESGTGPRDDFVRRGLAWVLGLARVEIGAMLAGFTSHENPFLSQAPTTFAAARVRSQPYGAAEFRELLLDALRTHYWALQRDPVASNYYKVGVPENHLVTYARRTIVGNHLIRAVRGIVSGSEPESAGMGPVQATLKTWEDVFQKIQRMTLYCLTFKVGHDKTTECKWTINKVISVSSAGPVYKRFDDEARDVNGDPLPEGIRNVLLSIDPTLAACPCQ